MTINYSIKEVALSQARAHWTIISNLPLGISDSLRLGDTFSLLQVSWCSQLRLPLCPEYARGVVCFISWSGQNNHRLDWFHISILCMGVLSTYNRDTNCFKTDPRDPDESTLKSNHDIDMITPPICILFSSNALTPTKRRECAQSLFACKVP